ncbi:MAG TPA: type II secretion system protein GspM [Gammaproteobacteria bacterium]|nr:type II secretion system protein GspM [Gammaproteobacteria bacterium]
MNSTTMKHSRLLACGIALTLVATILSLTVVPVWAVNAHMRSSIADLSDRLVRYESISEHDALLRRHYARLTEARSSTGQLLKSESESVAAAEIQRALRSITDDNEASLLSTQMLPSSELDEEGLQPVGLRVRIRGTLPSVIHSVYELESNSMLLFLENFSLRIAGDRRLGNTPATRYFEAHFDVIGLMSVLK